MHSGLARWGKLLARMPPTLRWPFKPKRPLFSAPARKAFFFSASPPPTLKQMFILLRTNLSGTTRYTSEYLSRVSYTIFALSLEASSCPSIFFVPYVCIGPAITWPATQTSKMGKVLYSELFFAIAGQSSTIGPTGRSKALSNSGEA